MKQGRWRTYSQEAIKEAATVFADTFNKRISPSCTDDEKKAFVKLMDGHYPFGQRKMHPYKAWLSERKKVLSWIYMSPKDDLVQGGLFAQGDKA